MINGIVQVIVKEAQPFERLVLPKEKALEMFSYNKYKVQLIDEKVPDGGTFNMFSSCSLALSYLYCLSLRTLDRFVQRTSCS